jgi:hypothetical protein
VVPSKLTVNDGLGVAMRYEVCTLWDLEPHGLMVNPRILISTAVREQYFAARIRSRGEQVALRFYSYAQPMNELGDAGLPDDADAPK